MSLFRSAVFAASVFAAAVAGAIVATPGSASAATAFEGSMFLKASSVIGFPVLARDDSAPSSDNWSNVPADLSVTARATATLGGDSVVTHASESASWLSATKGSIQVTDYGHEFNVSDGSISQIETLVGGGGSQPDWSYAFRADADGAFNLDFGILGRGDELFGLGRWQIEFVGDGLEFFTLSDGFQARHPEANQLSGTFSHALRQGVNYRVSLIGLNGLGTFAPNHQSGAMDATFNWSISENPAGVPEPSTWALAILGFGLAGAALRRKSPLAA